MERKQSFILFFLIQVQATDFGVEAFHMRKEMILKSRKLEGLGDSGLSFLRPFTAPQGGPREGEEGNQMFRANRSFHFLPGCGFQFPKIRKEV